MTAHFYDELMRLNPNATEEQIAIAQARDVEADQIAAQIAAQKLVYYKALSDSWGALTGTTVEKLAAINAQVDSNGNPWWQANGYTSPFTEDDLFGAGGLV